MLRTQIDNTASDSNIKNIFKETINIFVQKKFL